jgi:tRNA A-37 threonylcarbamoyl transferase component Bud32
MRVFRAFQAHGLWPEAKRSLSLSDWRVIRGTASPEAISILKAFEQGKALPPEVTVLRRGNTRTTLFVPGVGVFKILRRVGTRAMMHSIFLPSSLTMEYDLTVAASQLGIPVAEPIFCAERRVLGVLRGAALMLRIVPEACSLEDIIRRISPRPGYTKRAITSRKSCFSKYGRILAHLHRMGGIHGDPSPDNILVNERSSEPIALIDWAFALFAVSPIKAGPMGRYLLAESAANRQGVDRATINAALTQYADLGEASADFIRLCRNDVSKMVLSMLLFGAPLRDIVVCFRSYVRELKLHPDQITDLVDDLYAKLAVLLRHSLRRTLRNACYNSRRIAVFREESTPVYYRRKFSADAVRIALLTTESNAPVGGQATERRSHQDALGVWRNACLLARLNLPARRHIACRITHGATGILLLEFDEKRFVMPGAILSSQLADFARRLHAWGLRFNRCVPGTILQESNPSDQEATSCEVRYLLDDPGAVTFAPDEPIENSTDIVAHWVRNHAGNESASSFVAKTNRRLRFRL